MRYYIGIDIGGTKTSIVLSDGKKIIKELKIENDSNFLFTEKKLKFLINSLLKNYDAIAIGIAVAGLVKRDVLHFAPNLNNEGLLAFKKWWPKHKVFVLNDAHAFSLYHYHFNRKLKSKNFFSLILGTGVGRFFVKSKKVKAIKSLELPEKWEEEYKNANDLGQYDKLVEIVASGLRSLLLHYKTNNILLSGGLIKNLRVKEMLKTKFKDLNVYISDLSDQEVALGAVLYAKNKIKKK